MKAVQEFLKEIGFIQTWDEMEAVEKTFIDHMKKGMNGQKSSLPMLPAYLTVDSLPEESRDVIVMDAGGTNLRVALLRVNPGSKPEMLWQHKQPVPGKPGPLAPEAFFDALAQAVAPVADRSDRIGFCFSFPCRIRPDYDGEIIYLDKELNMPGIEGALVGENLKKALGRRGVKNDHKIVILNDTVAALLGALAEHPAGCYNGYIGMILGTLSMTVFGTAFNAVYLLPKFAELYGIPLEAILAMGAEIRGGINSVTSFVILCVAPLNLLKGTVISLLTLLLYKRVAKPLFGIHRS